MNPLVRALLLAAALLAAFLLAAFSLQVWLRREGAALREESTRRGAETLRAALELAPFAPEDWDESRRDRLTAVLGVEVTLHRTGEPPPPAVDGGSVFSEPLPGHPGWLVSGSLAPLPAGRWQYLHQRSLALQVLLALLLVSVPVVAAFVSRRRPPGADTRAPWRAARSEAAGLERFARLTVERGAALEREHDARLRAEEDLQVSRSLLDRSLEERVQLGRDLHDNISQTLYAVTLTLESVRRNMTATPAIEQRLDQCMTELRRLNQSVRAYIRDLEPASVGQAPFAAALAEALRTVGAAHGVEIDLRLGDEIAPLVPPRQGVEVLSIAREAVSNSARHGAARKVTVRAARGDGVMVLAIGDDGRGFDPAQTPSGGHGLGNMRARAAALGGSLQVESAPGKGTRVLLTLPLDPAPAS